MLNYNHVKSKGFILIILSADIGSRNFAHSILNFDEEQKTFTLVKSVYTHLAADKIGDRLLVLQKRLEKDVEDHLVDLILFENSKFSGKFAQDLNFVCGIMHLVAATYNLPIKWMSPTALKKGITGVGTAGKKEVDDAVKNYLTNPPARFETNHESDAAALGVAYCLKEYFK